MHILRSCKVQQLLQLQYVCPQTVSGSVVGKRFARVVNAVCHVLICTQCIWGRNFLFMCWFEDDIHRSKCSERYMNIIDSARVYTVGREREGGREKNVISGVHI